MNRWLSCAVFASALSLRVIYPTAYPSGFNDDEADNYASARAAWLQLWQTNDLHIILRPTGHQISPLLPMLGAAPFDALVPWIGRRFVYRGFALVGGALSCLVLVALCRTMRLTSAGAWMAGALCAVLPWSLYYGRLTLGGELLCCASIAVWACARLVWCERAGVGTVALGVLAATSAAYCYWNGPVLIVLPLAVLPLVAGWRRRLWCVVFVLAALLCWLPWALASPETHALVRVLRGEIGVPLRIGTWERAPLEWTALSGRLAACARALWTPTAFWSIWTTPAVLMHPPSVLAAAAVGFACAGRDPRVQWFLLAWLALGLAPDVLSSSPLPSGHRCLLALPVLTVYAAVAVSALRSRAAQWCAAGALVALAASYSVPFFFSAAFWPGGTTAGYPFAY